MTDQPQTLPKSKTSLVLLIWSVSALAFWLLVLTTDVYYFTLGGVVYELLWLPMLASLLILPIWSFILWKKENYNFRSFNFYSITVIFLIVLMIYFLS